MGHQLNTDSDRASAAATPLSELTGESLWAAVTVALEERLEREQKAHDRASKLARMRQIADEVAARMELGITSDHSWLYDENGLPR